MPEQTTVRFGIAVEHESPVHVHFRLFAATGGQHLAQCGKLIMTRAEYEAFRATLGPLLTDRADPPAEPVEGRNV